MIGSAVSDLDCTAVVGRTGSVAVSAVGASAEAGSDCWTGVEGASGRAACGAFSSTIGPLSAFVLTSATGKAGRGERGSAARRVGVALFCSASGGAGAARGALASGDTRAGSADVGAA